MTHIWHQILLTHVMWWHMWYDDTCNVISYRSTINSAAFFSVTPLTSHNENIFGHSKSPNDDQHVNAVDLLSWHNWSSGDWDMPRLQPSFLDKLEDTWSEDCQRTTHRWLAKNIRGCHRGDPGCPCECSSLLPPLLEHVGTTNLQWHAMTALADSFLESPPWPRWKASRQASWNSQVLKDCHRRVVALCCHIRLQMSKMSKVSTLPKVFKVSNVLRSIH